MSTVFWDAWYTMLRVFFTEFERKIWKTQEIGTHRMRTLWKTRITFNFGNARSGIQIAHFRQQEHFHFRTRS